MITLVSIWRVVQVSSPNVGKNKQNLKKKPSVTEKKFGTETNTEIEPSFGFPIPKLNFGLTLPHPMPVFKIQQFPCRPLIFLIKSG